MAIQGKKKKELTMDSIMEKLSDYDIFRYYMPTKNWELNEVTYSPFREENNPSFLIGNKRGYISYIDFGDTSKRGDCFSFVKQLYNLSTLDDVLKMIDRDFKLGITSGVDTGEYKKITGEYKQPEVTKRNSLIQVISRKFTKEELAYWNEYHQDIEDLRKNNIYSIKKLFLNKKVFFLKDTELRFGYFYDGHWKIYRPFASKKEKWMPNNVPITAMDGKDNLRKDQKAFINKSKKDKMVVEKVYPYSIGVQNEGIACFSPENVDFIKENSTEQILGFDSDDTGVKNSQQITQIFNFGYCNVPRFYAPIKDFADLGKTHGLKEIEKIFKLKGII
jgi:hypothetical protein